MVRRLDRVLWTPPIPLACLVYFILRLSVSGVTAFRLFSTIWILVWSALSLYNWRSGGKVLRWLYSDDDGPGSGSDDAVN